MNYRAVALSANSTSFTSVKSEEILFDRTTLTISISGLTEEFIPLYLKINWGDGNEEVFQNSPYKVYREDSIFNEVLYGKYSQIFNTDYTHVYYPSNTSRFKNLSAQVLVEYSDGNFCWFIIPIEIVTGDYFETIYDMKQIGVNTLPVSANTIQHTFSIDAGGFLIEAYN